MNRLFWKFFAGLLLAQIATTAVVVSFIWFKDAPHLRQLERHQVSEIRFESVSPPPALAPPEFRGPPLPLRPVVVGFFTSLLFAYVFARYVAKPITELRYGFQEVGAGRFTYRVSPKLGGRRDELADLGRAFDKTSERLLNLMDSQKRLLHDVSHEVRSPLARMQLAIDLLEQQPERQQELLQRISRESTRVNTLMSEVLTLARLETAATWSMTDQIDLQELIDEVVNDVSFEAAEKPCTIIAHLPHQPIVILGNAELLHRAIENVLRNAIRYTSVDTQVSVVVRHENSAWRVEIRDFGPGIPEARLTHVFEPFERLGQPEDSSGYGLGLAIAAQTIKMHGGLLSAANIVDSQGSGLCVSMTLFEKPIRSEK